MNLALSLQTTNKLALNFNQNFYSIKKSKNTIDITLTLSENTEN